MNTYQSSRQTRTPWSLIGSVLSCLFSLVIIMLAQSSRAELPATVAAGPTAAPQMASRLSGLHGSQPFATLLCQFADITTEPDPAESFVRRMSASYPGLDHYWQTVSGGAIDLAGSAVYNWVVLPQPRSAYIDDKTTPATADLQRLAEDCAAAHDDVQFDRFTGINFIFNAEIGRPFGGRTCLTRDGREHCFGATWLFPAAYRHQALWAHEMGHAFGLSHSAVGEGNQYGNLWDVMSMQGPCSPSSELGRLPQYPIAYQLDQLGWLAVERKFIAASDVVAAITLTAQSFADAGGTLVAQINLDNSGRRYYTVEARRRAGYDATLPGDAVVIHMIDLDATPHARPMSTNGSEGQAGVTTGVASRWMQGMTFRDQEHAVAVSVDAETELGFAITIYTGSHATSLQTPVAMQHPAAMLATTAGALTTALQGVEANGLAYMGWIETVVESGDGVMTNDQARSTLYFRQQAADHTWGAAEAIDAESPVVRANLTLAVDAQGNVYAAWTDQRDGIPVIVTAYRQSSGAWTHSTAAPQVAKDGIAGLVLTVERSGAVRLMWEGLDQCSNGAVVVASR